MPPRRIHDNDNENFRRRVVVYELDNGRRVSLCANAVRKHGAQAMLETFGLMPKGLALERVPVYQWGRKVGTVPAMFDPQFIQSTSLFYEPRPSDFIREGSRWIVDKMLGPGDLDAVPGFRWDREKAE